MTPKAAQVVRGFFDAAERFSGLRLPELFAGLERDRGAFPVQYQGANVPQAWASGAVVQLVAALLGLDADADARQLAVRPALPDWLPEISVKGLSVGEATVDLRGSRSTDGEHHLDVVPVTGDLEVYLDQPSMLR
ncbi:MAG: hypothetical protein H0W70_00395 [Actinobacteria bacterium]|nr:hypothetical protein [Actinomycetota bacterium]